MRLRICSYFPYFRVFSKISTSIFYISTFPYIKSQKNVKNTIKSTYGNSVSDAVADRLRLKAKQAQAANTALSWAVEL